MGCDIHFNVEKKINGEWTEVFTGQRRQYGDEGEITNPDPSVKLVDGVYLPDPEYKSPEGLKREQSTLPFGTEEDNDVPPDELNTPHDYSIVKGNGWLNEFYEGRNYGLFAVLANVRNYDDFPYISEPRGLPEDVSKSILKRAKRWGCDGHSHTYYTLKELLDYDWDGQLNECSGIMSEFEYLVWKKSGDMTPGSYCRGVSGANIITLTEDDYLEKTKNLIEDKTNQDPYMALLDDPEKIKALSWADRFRISHMAQGPVSGLMKKSVHIKAKWFESARMVAGKYWWERTMPALQAIAGDEPENVRIVFWFDN